MKKTLYFLCTLSNLLIFVGLLLFSTSILSQTLSGRVYDENTSVLQGVTVFNKNNKKATVTDENGEFVIQAKVNDTLIFQSSFHQTQQKIASLADFETLLIAELKKEVNTLDEVLLSEKEKEFDAEKYSTNLKKQIKKDIENNPFDYGEAPVGGINLMTIVKAVISIFKKKPEKEIIYATQTDFIQLFERDEFFNENLLENNLKIPKQYKNLFLDYCAAKEIEESLLKEENKFQLLDILVVSSNEFRDIIAKYEDK